MCSVKVSWAWILTLVGFWTCCFRTDQEKWLVQIQTRWRSIGQLIRLIGNRSVTDQRGRTSQMRRWAEGLNWMVEIFRSSDLILSWTSLMDSGTLPETSVCQHSSPTIYWCRFKMDHQRRRHMWTSSRITSVFSGSKIIWDGLRINETVLRSDGPTMDHQRRRFIWTPSRTTRVFSRPKIIWDGLRINETVLRSDEPTMEAVSFRLKIRGTIQMLSVQQLHLWWSGVD